MFNRSLLFAPMLLVAISVLPLASAESIVQFTYQSQNIRLTEWISLLTLCLAPFIAHIIGGVPTPIYLSQHRPRWHDLLGHFNPTSILWRYFVITDRRLRAKKWNPADMAASCALFWTSDGWDGSEEMMVRSRAFCTRVPSLGRIRFASISAATTLIVTIQGVQSVYSPAQGFFDGGYSFQISFESVFLSIAFLGLMRLPAALWLTEDFSYSDIDTIRRVEDEPGERVELERMDSKPDSFRSLASVGLLAINDERLPWERRASPSGFHPSNSGCSLLIRGLFVIPVVVAVGGAIGLAAQSQPGYGMFFTGTHIALISFYLMLSTGVIAILSYYFWTGQTRTTVLPCVCSMWYKVYTAVMAVLMLAVLVIAGLETRRSPCGIYTTMRPYYDQFGCARNSCREAVSRKWHT